MQHSRQFVAIILLGIFLLGSTAFAAIPGTPEQFKATIQQDQKGGYLVRLEWKLNQAGGIPTYFVIYKASGAVSDPALFSKLTKVTPSKDSNGVYFIDYKYDISGLQTGEYSFYMNAMNAEGTSQPTQIEVVSIRQSSQMYFTTSPAKNWLINKEYLYDAEAKSNQAGDIRYVGLNLPQGASVDSLTGVFKYTTSVEGKQTFAMKAYLASDPTLNVTQQWYVLFSKDSSGNPATGCAVITGSVVDQNGNPMRTGNVKAYVVDSSAGQNTYGTISGGTFKLSVKEGTYALYVMGQDFTAEWYQDAASLQAAQRFVIKCNDSVHVAFTVQSVVTKKLSGKVTAEADGSPQMATIIVKAKDGSMKYSFVTDQAGNYSLSLPENVEYIISAYPKNAAYYPQYYNKVADIALATPVLLDADKSGIDFALVKKPTFNNGMKGTVKDSAGNTGVASLVTAYFMNQGKPDKSYSFTASTDSFGVFELKSLQPGSYILFTTPGNRELIPGYYKENSLAVNSWDQATVVTVTDNGIVSGITIRLQKRWGLKGIAVLKGKVFGKTSGVAPIQDPPLAGALVLIKDRHGKVCDYGFSDIDGEFQLTDAAAGSFTVVSDKIGFTGYSSPVEFNYSDKALVEITFSMTPATTTGISDPSPIAENFAIDLYPNPTTDIMNIRLNRLTEKATMKIFNEIGVEIYSSIIREADDQTFAVAVSALPAGTYFVKVIGVKVRRTVQFTIVR